MKLADRLSELVGAEAVDLWTEPATGRELPLARPRDEETCTELVHLAGRDGLAVIPLGLGGKTSWCAPASSADFALSTRALAGVTAYEPGDGTVAARAGTSMAELREVVHGGGHRLTPDVPRPEEATLGGVVAAGQSGFDRLRFGPVRDHVLGLRVLLGDGTTARSGGRLVKNVTGYDLHRLYTGSHGSLCLVLEAALRLFPLPEDEAVFAGRTESLATALEVLAAARELPLPWDTLTVGGSEGDFRVLAALSGRETVLSTRRSEVENCLADLDGLELARGDDAVRLRESARDEESDGGWPDLRLLARPSRLADGAARLLSALDELGESRPLLRAHPAVATLDLRLGRLAGEARLDLVRELADVAERDGLRIQWRGSRRDFPGELQTLGPVSPALSFMRSIQDALDPGRVFARGRFHGGL